MKQVLCRAVVVVIAAATSWSVAAQVPTKTARDCAREYKIRKPDLVGAQRHKANFIALCHVTAVGVPTPSDNEALASGLDVFHPGEGYKDGFMFTPAYLSSPQVFDWLRHRPD